MVGFSEAGTINTYVLSKMHISNYKLQFKDAEKVENQAMWPYCGGSICLLAVLFFLTKREFLINLVEGPRGIKSLLSGNDGIISACVCR